MHRTFLPLLVVVLSVLSSISGPRALAQSTPPAEEDIPACVTEYQAASAEPGFTDPELEDWQTRELTNARTGETFAVSDFLGCTVFFETMATWCSNCLAQLTTVSEVVPLLDPERHIVIAISVETELSAEDLANYADSHEFRWLFAVADAEMIRAIVDEFGRESIVPPSTPHVIVDPDGRSGELRTGLDSAEDILEMMTTVDAQ